MKVDRGEGRATRRGAIPHLATYIKNEPVQQVKSARFLGLHLGSKLKWKTVKERGQLKVRFCKMFWILRVKNRLSLANKKLFYVTVVRPSSLVGRMVFHWRAQQRINIETIQIFQNTVLRKIAVAS